MQDDVTEYQIRYDRHLRLPGFGPEAQTRLTNSSVLVVGAGGLGCPVLQYLTAAGVGRIGIADHDKVDLSNLQRQVLYSTADIGKHKAQVAAGKLYAMNPLLKFDVYTTKLTSENALSILAPYDIVVDGTDNFPTRYLLNDASILLNKPLIFGSINKFEGQVSIFNYQNGPSYRCLYPEPPAPGTVPSCSEIGVLGVLPGLIGTLQANEVIKVLTGIGEPLNGKLMILDALTLRQTILKIKKSFDNSLIKELIDYDDFCGVKMKNEITPDELEQWIKEEKGFNILDVREEWEFEQFNIGGMHLPIGELESRAEEMDLSRQIVVVCQSGTRSAKAITILQRLHPSGRFINLRGGLLDMI